MEQIIPFIWELIQEFSSVYREINQINQEVQVEELKLQVWQQ